MQEIFEISVIDLTFYASQMAQNDFKNQTPELVYETLTRLLQAAQKIVQIALARDFD